MSTLFFFFRPHREREREDRKQANWLCATRYREIYGFLIASSETRGFWTLNLWTSGASLFIQFFFAISAPRNIMLLGFVHESLKNLINHNNFLMLFFRKNVRLRCLLFDWDAKKPFQSVLYNGINWCEKITRGYRVQHFSTIRRDSVKIKHER